jgi:hypothetical protein
LKFFASRTGSRCHIMTHMTPKMMQQDATRHHVAARNTTALLRLPQNDNLQGCSPHPSSHFENRIALIERGVRD